MRVAVAIMATTTGKATVTVRDGVRFGSGSRLSPQNRGPSDLIDVLSSA